MIILMASAGLDDHAAHGARRPTLQQTVDEGQGFVAGIDLAVELGVADLIEDRSEVGAGAEAVIDQVAAAQ